PPIGGAGGPRQTRMSAPRGTVAPSVSPARLTRAPRCPASEETGRGDGHHPERRRLRHRGDGDVVQTDVEAGRRRADERDRGAGAGGGEVEVEVLPLVAGGGRGVREGL